MAVYTNRRTSQGGRHRVDRGGSHISEFLTSPRVNSGYARHIGRVGALAVALGVGAAVATGHGMGVARADDDPRTNENAATADAPSDTRSSESGAQAPQSGSNNSDADDPTGDHSDAGMNVDSSGGQDTSGNDGGQFTDDNATSEHDDDAAGDVDGATQTPTPSDPTPAPTPEEPTPPPASSAPQQPAPQDNSDPAPPTGTTLPDSSSPADGPDSGSPVDTSTPPTGSPTLARLSFAPAADSQGMQLLSSGAEESAFSMLADTTPVTTPNAAMGLPGALVRVVTTVVGVLLSPFLAPGPNAPTEPPLLWAVLAFVRREITRAFFNHTPHAVADQVTTGQEDKATVIDVLANDQDEDSLTVTGITQPAHGTVAINSDGTLTYTPKPNYSGTETFTYTVSDEESPFHLHGFFGLFGRGHADTATVTVTVAPVNDSPVADNDAYTVGEDGTLEVAAADGVLNGDTDVDNTVAQLSAVLGTGPAHGTLTLNSNGSFTYKPTAEFNGADSFTYRASDGTIPSNLATVSIIITPDAEQGPVADTPAFTIDAIDTVTGVVTGWINAHDPDGDELTYTLATEISPEMGTVEVDSATGAFTFAPTPAARLDAWSAAGNDALAFDVTVSDGELSSDISVIASITPAAHSAVENISGAEQESWGNQGLAVGADGRFYMTTYLVDGTAGEVVVLNPDGTYAATVDIADKIPYAFASAYDVVVGPDGRVYVSGEVGETADEVGEETGRGFVVAIDPDDDYAVTLLAETADPASAITVDGAGRLYVANWNNDTVTVLNSDGSLYDVIESPELVDGDDSGVAGLAVGPNGQLYLTKPQLGVVKVVNPDGSIAHTFEVGGEPWAIDVADNGIAYVTDFNDARVIGLDAAGAVVRTVGLGYDVSPSDITVTADGRVYVSYMTANGGAIAIVSAVPVAGPDSTAIGDPVAGLPVNVRAVSSPVVATDVIYQTVTGTDAVSGEIVTTVAVIGSDGTTTFARVSGEPVGALVLGPNDVGYQTVRRLDTATGAYDSGVLVVTPTGRQTFSGWNSGEPAGTVVFGSGDIAYQVISHHDADTDTYTTTVLKISPTGVTPYAVDGYSGGLGSGEPSGMVAGPDGTLYLTTTDTPDGEPGPVTTLTVFGPSSVTSHSIAGMASGPATIANGTVLQTVGTFGIEPGSDIGTFTSVVAVLTESGLVPLADTTTGLPLGSPVVGAHGTVYQTVVNFDASPDAADSTPTTTIAVITATGLAPAFEGIPGTPMNPDGAFIPLVAGADGAVYQATYGFTDPSTGEPVTLVAGLSSTGVQFGALIPGQPVGTVVPGSDGVAYQTTYESATGTTRVAVIAPSGNTVHEFDGYPGNPASGDLTLTPVVVGPDGIAYQTLGARDEITLAYSTTVAIISPNGVDIVSFDGFPSGPVVFGPDGSAYQTVGVIDFSTQTVFTQIVAVDPTGLLPVGDVIRGNPAGPVAFGSDGLLYQTVFSDDGAGSFATTVHVVDTSAPAAGRMMAGLARTAAAVSFTTSYIRTIDSAYLAPFNAADPTGRFSYTRVINNSRGQTVDLTPMSDAALVKFVNDYIGHTGTGSQGFSRDSQGRITYRNTTGQDVLVVYGARPDQPAQGAQVARPGATVTLPAGPEGRVAAAQFAGTGDSVNWIAVAYRGATPVPTTKPKTSIVLASTNSASTRGMSAVDLAGRIPDSDQVRVEIVRSNTDQQTRMVVYMGGVISPDLDNFLSLGALTNFGTWLEAYQVRYFGHIPGRVSKAIDDAIKAAKPGAVPTEIMLVGHSKGGMIAQNYAESGTYKDKVKMVVTYGSPIIKSTSNKYLAIHLHDTSDFINKFHDKNSFNSNVTNGRVYTTPPTNISDKHGMGNYTQVARNFEWDSKWTTIKDRMATFRGTLTATNPKPESIWGLIGFA